MCSRKIQMRYMICWSRDEERVGGVGQDGSDVRFSRGQLWPWGAGQKDGGGGNIPVESAIFDFFLPEFFLLQPRLRLDPTHTRTMAGDHKCPVCQATFTRPQHVARHMRSRTSFPPNPSHTPYPLLSPTLPHLLTNSSPTDTGDRPYKCQHCGDQFARRSVYPLCYYRIFFPCRHAP